MPFYNYKCSDESCQDQHEVQQSIKADPLVICPKCGRETLRRIISAPGLIFKGEGWTPKHH